MDESGRLAYEGYHQAKYDMDNSHTWTWWPDLDPGEQDCWRAAAWNVIQKAWNQAARPPGGGKNRL